MIHLHGIPPNKKQPQTGFMKIQGWRDMWKTVECQSFRSLCAKFGISPNCNLCGEKELSCFLNTIFSRHTHIYIYIYTIYIYIYIYMYIYIYICIYYDFLDWWWFGLRYFPILDCLVAAQLLRPSKRRDAVPFRHQWGVPLRSSCCNCPLVN